MNQPLTCDQYREVMLSPGAAGNTSLGPQEIQRLHAHGEQCAACRQAAAEYERLRETLSIGCEETRNAEPDGGWSAFEMRMRNAISGKPLRVNAAIDGFGPWENRRRWRIAAGLLLAAGVGIAAGFLLRGAGPTPSSLSTGRGADPARVWLTGSELKQNVEAFDNISSVFDGRASWVMLADGGTQSDVGIAREPVDEHVLPLVIRMVVRRAPADAAARWDVVSQCDLVIVPGQTAELTVNSLDAHRLRFRVQTDASNLHRVTMMLELGGAGGQRRVDEERATRSAAAATARELPHGMLATTLLLDFGTSATVGQIVTSDGVFSLAAGLDALPAAASTKGENHL